MGTTGLTAQAFGRKDDREMVVTLGRAVFTGFMLGLILILVHRPVWEIASVLMNVTPEHADLVRT